jgi:hypothetical protein
MPSKDAKRAADQGRRMSRRSLLQGAATAGAAGLAVTALGTAPAFAATSKPASRSAEQLPDGPITVHVRDTKTGDIEIFAGTRETRLRDADLAARIARAIR